MRDKILPHLMLLLCVAAAAAAGEGERLTPLPQRVSDSSIAADLKTLEEVQNRLIALNRAGRPVNDYSWAKAHAWLDFAYDEYTENDRTGMIEAALDEAIRLIERMEAKDPSIPMETRIPHGKKQREDLWRLAEEIKQSPGFPDAAIFVAKLEVKLAQYSHEMAELGWRHAKHLLGEIEALAREAAARAAAYELRLRLEVSGFGRIVPEPEHEVYCCGDKVVLHAVPGAGWEFAAWEGAAAGQGNPATLALQRDADVTAVFRRLDYKVELQAEGGGRILVEHEGEAFRLGDPLVLLAEPDPGWAFDRWAGGLAGQSNPILLYVEGDLSGTAVFRPVDYTVAPRTVGAGFVGLEPERRYYRFGDLVTARATPARGWRFDHWEDAAAGEVNPMTLRVDGSRILTAVFHPLSAPPPEEAPPPAPNPVPTPAPAPAAKPVLRLPSAVHFALNKATISPKTAKILHDLARVLTANPEISVILVGHADPQGTSVANMVLSKERVTAVKDYMLGLGVSPGQLGVDFVGDTKPKTKGKSLRDYALERRVEFGYLTMTKTILVYEQEEDLQL